MKRLRQIIFNFLTVLSLLLCVGTAVLWLRSNRVQDQLQYTPTNSDTPQMRAWVFRSNTGILIAHEFQWGPHPLSTLEGWSLFHLKPEAFNGRNTIAKRMGFYAWSNSALGKGVAVPHWLVVGMTGVFPAVWLRGFVRWRLRKHRHQCIRCGYDLRATPDRCPECGAIPTESKT